MTGALKAAVVGVLEDFKGHPAMLLVVLLNIIFLISLGWYLQNRAERTDKLVSAVIERCLPMSNRGG